MLMLPSARGYVGGAIAVLPYFAGASAVAPIGTSTFNYPAGVQNGDVIFALLWGYSNFSTPGGQYTSLFPSDYVYTPSGYIYFNLSWATRNNDNSVSPGVANLGGLTFAYRNVYPLSGPLSFNSVYSPNPAVVSPSALTAAQAGLIAVNLFGGLSDFGAPLIQLDTGFISAISPSFADIGYNWQIGLSDRPLPNGTATAGAGRMTCTAFNYAGGFAASFLLSALPVTGGGATGATGGGGVG
jgi:hypothetical protein